MTDDNTYPTEHFDPAEVGDLAILKLHWNDQDFDGPNRHRQNWRTEYEIALVAAVDRKGRITEIQRWGRSEPTLREWWFAIAFTYFLPAAKVDVEAAFAAAHEGAGDEPRRYEDMEAVQDLLRPYRRTAPHQGTLFGGGGA